MGLGEAGILPKDLVERIKGMPAFRNRIIQDYLPNEFDAMRLLDAIQHLEDFQNFSRHILAWLHKD